MRIGLAAFLLAATCRGGEWRQFGGPHRNFTAESGPLATDWDGMGPQELWSRELGDGFASILYEEGRLYTAHRRGDRDVVVALDAASGETLWEAEYQSPALQDMILDFGPGPIVTPLLSGDRLFTVSSTVRLRAWDKKSGAMLWGHDLMETMGASHMGRGFGPSPIAYEDTVILVLGGEENGVVAFDQESGEVVWKARGYGPSYSAPIVIEVAGEAQLAVVMRNHRLGLDPASGAVKWHLELPASAGTVMSTQIWGEDGILLGSSAYGDGTRALKLARRPDGEFQAEEMWYTRKLRVMFPPFQRRGDLVVGSSGDFGPTILVGLDVHTGKVAWRKRGFARAHLIAADGKLVVLDENGDLAIARATHRGFTVLCRANVIGRTAWTPPTLVGTRLFIRNRSHIKALELGAD